MATYEVKELTVLSSQVATSLRGRVAFVLQTRELGYIGFDVDQQALDMLKKGIATAEQSLMMPKPGTA